MPDGIAPTQLELAAILSRLLMCLHYAAAALHEESTIFRLDPDHDRTTDERG